MTAVLSLALLLGDSAHGAAIAPPPRVKHIRPTSYRGEVMAVTKDSVTIRGKDDCDRNGPDVVRTFKAATHLAKGEQDPAEASGTDYRLIDVKVGDKVSTKIRSAGDEASAWPALVRPGTYSPEDDLCLTISIRRRPSGLVPPAPFEKADVPHKYHIDANAYQANEERGVPLPLRLDEDYQRKQSEIHARWVDERFKQQQRIAPPPRPAVRK